jgi:hypothetical protein
MMNDVGTRLTLDLLLVLIIWDITRVLAQRLKPKQLAFDHSEGCEQEQ